MLGVGEEQHVFSKERLCDELRVLYWQVNNGCVDGAIGEARQERRCAALVHNGANTRMRVRERGEQARHELAGRGAKYSEAGFAHNFFVTGLDVGGDVVHLVHDAPGALGNSETLIGELAAVAVDEGGT